MLKTLSYILLFLAFLLAGCTQKAAPSSPTNTDNNANYCVLGPLEPIFGTDDVLATCYNSAGTQANTVFNIWVVQK